MAAARISILAVGLKQKSDSGPPAIPGMSPDQTKTIFAEELQKASDRGYELVPKMFAADDSDVLDAIKAVLAERKWDAVSIGGGVRCSAELTPVFEGLVNACVEVVTPAPKLLFPLRPQDIVDAADRVFGR